MRKTIWIILLLLIPIAAYLFFFGVGKRPVRRDLRAKAETDAEFASLICGFEVKKLLRPSVEITEITYGEDPNHLTATIAGLPEGSVLPNPSSCHATLTMDWYMAYRSSPGRSSGSVAVYKNFKKWN